MTGGIIPAGDAADAGAPKLPARGSPVAALGQGWQAFLRRSRALAPASMVALLLGALAVVLDVTPQGRDVVAAQFSDDQHLHLFRVATLALSLAVCSFVAWAVSRKAVTNAFGTDWSEWKPWHRQQWFLWLPRLLWLAPFAILIAPLLTAGNVTNLMLVGTAAVSLGAMLIGAVLVTLIGLRRGLAWIWGPANSWNDFPWLGGIGAVAGLGIVVFVVLLVSKVDVPQAIGAPAIGLFAAAAIIAMLGVFYHLLMYRPADAVGDSDAAKAIRAKTGGVRFLPLLGMLALWAGACSWFNDNHVVAGRGSAALGPAVGRSTLDEAIDSFIAQVPRTPGEPVPIIFVATAGGASRAAYWTGEVLGALERQTKGRFGRHVFAISSVSGGTLGAAAYLAERAEDTPPDAITARMRDENGADHLSPAIAGLLFPDLLQRFLPLPWLPDRAQYLERSFEAAWRADKSRGREACLPGGTRTPFPRDGHAASRFERPMRELWTCAALRADGTPVWVPVFLANGTRAEDGRRIVTSSVKLTPGTLRDALDFHDLFKVDVPLSVVVTNSARFPIVSPSGTLPRGDSGGPQGHLLDGGYFENGGIASAVELKQAVERHLAARHWPFQPRYVFIEINNDDGGNPQRRADEIVSLRPSVPPAEVAGLRGIDALLPVFGLYQTRGARGTLEALRTRQDLADTKEDYVLFQLCPLWDHDHPFATEMNWALSKRARARLDGAFDGSAKDPGCLWPQAIAQIRALFPDPPGGPVGGAQSGEKRS